ncbi:MAG: type II 3-dehydroquinate dehydratase [Fidelibacterota bacterium]|jgi:3-dehydroquinate dehydratase|nr:type II 3-dehydroquinate dehydratase [Candidatus Neomarinimicrobiota bacterium]|tara:strand:- start:1382 stop:1807 length:426 start_codon:yes stop_codon:yes gene_type:complete
MNILILHGPNLNLLGSKSAEIGEKITIDKINTGIRRHIRKEDLQIKILQTHKQFHAINFIQRNRNWADFFLIAPMSWARYEYSILDALKISKIKTLQILFTDNYSDITKSNSIFSEFCTSTLIGSPDKVYLEGLDHIQKMI